jgi:hypothetical protein
MALGVNRPSAVAENNLADAENVAIGTMHSVTITTMECKQIASNPPAAVGSVADLTALEATTAVLEGISFARQDCSDVRGPSRAPDIASDAFANTDDDMKPARGILNGVLFAVPMWGAIGLLIWFFLGR